VLHFTDYGSDFIKKVGRVSPDAFVQMALQATYYRIHKKWAVTYETASTRKFHHGRTETCRSLSWDMQQFVSAFENYTLGSSEKFKSEVVTLFRKASEAHVATLTTASNGQGVDRHLLGLRMVLQPGETKHPLFTHPSFSKSSTWTLSTSALFSGERVWGTGFGCVDPKGYGMNYLIASDVIKVGIESKKSCVETSSARFKSTLQGVLLDFKTLLESSSKL
jgi:carnitine O-acetyltransferase